MKVKSTVRINTTAIKQLDEAVKKSLEQTAEALHDDIVDAQVIPRMDGDLQGVKFSVDTSQVSQGKVRLVHEGPYARRWYYNPEQVKIKEFVRKYATKNGKKEKTIKSHTAHKAVFSKDENPNAKDHWFEDWLPNGTKQDFIADTFKDLLKRNGGL